jgi:hypothetical protein
MTTKMGEVRTFVRPEKALSILQKLKLLKLERSSIVTRIVMPYNANNV